MHSKDVVVRRPSNNGGQTRSRLRTSSFKKLNAWYAKVIPGAGIEAWAEARWERKLLRMILLPIQLAGNI